MVHERQFGRNFQFANISALIFLLFNFEHSSPSDGQCDPLNASFSRGNLRFYQSPALDNRISIFIATSDCHTRLKSIPKQRQLIPTKGRNLLCSVQSSAPAK
ncbi:MAG: hypothetical protein DMG63_07830 [Acidobacteria bacterium]|nr:MAG: hypothetical protein DMG63_07830 [Acidobacteriota bacterium]